MTDSNEESEQDGVILRGSHLIVLEMPFPLMHLICALGCCEGVTVLILLKTPSDHIQVFENIGL